jgi:hypothetical protein
LHRTPGEEIHITTVVVRRAAGTAHLHPEQLHRKILASLSQTRSHLSWLYRGLSAACLVGAVWAAYRAVHPH